MANSAAAASSSRRFASTAAQQGSDVVIAIGSNLGNRGLNLHHGLRRLRELGVQVFRHSALYETAAAYVTDQPSFLNAAVLARTSLPPRELLKVLKQVEAEAGRDLAGGQRFGPRPLDLDIIFYGSQDIADAALCVPHPRWHERPFVQAPVSDLCYRRDLANLAAAAAHHHHRSHPDVLSGRRRGDQGGSSGAAVGVPGLGPISPLDDPSDPGCVLNHLKAVRERWTGERGATALGKVSGPAGVEGSRPAVAGGGVMRRVTPLVNLPGPLPDPPTPQQSAPSASGRDPNAPLPSVGTAGPAGSSVVGPSGAADALLSWGRRTYLMAILNVTPDSFSDGGRHGGSVAAAVAAAEQMVAAGADLIDVGGQSTRPGATRLSPGEELARVMPVIRALRQSPRLRHVPLSVDTFSSDVAREAVAGGGANIVNDVSGGTLDPHMLRTVAELGVPYVLMHMRGDPTSMTLPQHTTYASGSVWREVGRELQHRAEAAEAAGVPAWNIILDPGIGFAKTAEGNLELLRHLPELRREALDGPYGATAAATSSPAAGCCAGGPLLLGPSRKRFLAAVTGSGREDPTQRDAATAAACVVCVGGGADIVRVHDVAAVRDAVRLADAVYR